MTPFLFGPGEVRISSARSCNSTWALVQQLDGWIHLYDTQGRFVRDLFQSIRADTQAVFSRTSQDHVLTVDGVDVRQNGLLDGTITPVRSFVEYVNLSAAHAEGDLTPDNWLALCGVRDGIEHAFCFNVVTKETGIVVDLAGPIDGLKAAVGGWLLVSSDNGIYAYSRAGGGHLLAPANGHACTAVYNGRPVLLWCNSADPSVNNNGIEIIDIETAERRLLKSFPWAYAMHVSEDIVSVYDPMGNLPNQLWRVPFDGSAAELLHEWRAAYRGYISTPRASCGDGLVLWNVDDGQTVSVWGLRIEEMPATIPISTQSPVETRIDYSPWVGKSEFVLRPRADGAVDIFERKL